VGASKHHHQKLASE
jgi:hypothetical protein